MAAHSLKKNMIGTTFWEKKHAWQHILGKVKIVSAFWGKHDWQHILLKNMVGSTFWEKNIIGRKFWGKT
jgi:hypothetical protein